MEDVRAMSDDEFMKKYERLVHHSVYKMYANQAKSIEHETGLDLEDLAQCGMIGLVKARNTFKSELGIKFSTYAIKKIIWEMQQNIRDLQKMKITREIYEIKGKIIRRKIQENTPQEIAKLLGVSEECAELALQYNSKTESLQKVIMKPNNKTNPLMTLQDTIADEDSKDWEEVILNKIVVDSFLQGLDDNEFIILDLHRKEYTQREIANELDVYQVKVHRSFKKVMNKLDKYSDENSLRLA